MIHDFEQPIFTGWLGFCMSVLVEEF